MKVYVCYSQYPYEGCTTPEEVFADEEKAKEWVASKGYLYNYRSYSEMEVTI